jgi:hypothetical protein
MKIYQDVLSSSVISLCLVELDDRLKTGCWNSSQQFWSDDILQNVTGHCLVTPCSDSLESSLTSDLSLVLPSADQLVFQFYVWHKNSGISLHRDKNYRWGATLYLTQEWHLNYGGIFLWLDKDTQELRARLPVFNQLIVNDELESHMVTPVGANIPSTRNTIQIWGK